MSADKYDAIVKAIEEALASGVPAWRQPWRDLGAAGNATFPINAVSGKEYRGVNVPVLWLAAQRNGWTDMRFLTYNQARNLGGHVRKGERGQPVIFWKPLERRTTEGKVERTLLMRFYTVFNVAQCDDLPARKEVPQAPVPPVMSEVYEKLRATVKHGGDRAYYQPELDFIGMPLPAAFSSADAYAATALHELTHWTGHKERLDRDLCTRFGAQAYAAEELVAELGSVFLCAALGVNTVLEHHASYVDNWRQLLRDDPRAIITAASKAQAACDFILGRVAGKGAEEEDVDVAQAA